MSKKIDLDDAYTIKTPADNIELYAKWADTYDADFAKSTDYELPLHVAQVVYEICPSGTVLDVGSGTGLLAQSLDTLGRYVIDATDISPDMLRIARGKNVYRTLFPSDVTKGMDVASQTYDVTTSSGTFTHGHVGPEAITELLRVTKMGGAVVISVNCEFWHKNGFEAALNEISPNVRSIGMRRVAIYGSGAVGDHAKDEAFIVIIQT
jgi:predicted TPR repeat methyltransferase